MHGTGVSSVLINKLIKPPNTKTDPYCLGKNHSRNASYWFIKISGAGFRISWENSNLVYYIRASAAPTHGCEVNHM